jgi:glycine dehydrogenase
VSREFADRHLGPSPTEIETMLATVDVESVAELVDRAVPEAIRDRTPLDLPTGLTEAQALARLRALADRNEVLTSLIGAGYSGTITPPVIQRNVLEDPAWYTAYTPYQPEISQGRLEALLNFQTLVSDRHRAPAADTG